MTPESATSKDFHMEKQIEDEPKNTTRPRATGACEERQLTLPLLESNFESINVVVTFKSVDTALVCDHSNESY